VLAGVEHSAARAVDPDHVGTEVGQDHARVRARADARDLDDLDPLQRARAVAEFVRHGPSMTPGLWVSFPGYPGNFPLGPHCFAHKA
jgi:hypothetical protein